MSNFVDPETDDTECHECEATIEIGEDETVAEAIVRHRTAAHGFGE